MSRSFRCSGAHLYVLLLSAALLAFSGACAWSQCPQNILMTTVAPLGGTTHTGTVDIDVIMTAAPVGWHWSRVYAEIWDVTYVRSR